MERKNNIREFIEELENLQRHEVISKRDYRLLTEKYGLSSPDLGRIDYIARGHLERANSDASEGKLNSAIAELERGVIISPFDIEMRSALGFLFIERYKTKGYLKRDKERAVKIAEICSTQAPSSPEAKRLSKEVKSLDNIFRSKHNSKVFIPIAVVLLLIIIGGAVYSRREFILSRLGNGNKELAVEENIPPKTLKGIPLQKDVQIISSSIDDRELKIKIHKAFFRQTGTGYHFSLQGGVTPQKGVVTGLTMKLKWPGQTLEEQHTIELLNPEDPPLRPGDTIPIDDNFYFKKTPESIDQAELLLDSITVENPSSDYPASLPIKIYRSENLPEGAQLSLKLRNTRFLEGYDALHYGLVYELENSGYAPIEDLSLDFNWINDKSETVVSKGWHPVERGGPPLEAGTRWIKVLKIRSDTGTPVNTENSLISVQRTQK